MIHLSGHEEDPFLGSLKILLILVGEQLVDVLFPIVIRDTFRGDDAAAALLMAAASSSRYNLVIL